MQNNTTQHRIEKTATTATDHAPDDPGNIIEEILSLTEDECAKLLNIIRTEIRGRKSA